MLAHLPQAQPVLQARRQHALHQVAQPHMARQAGGWHPSAGADGWEGSRHVASRQRQLQGGDSQGKNIPKATVGGREGRQVLHKAAQCWAGGLQLVAQAAAAGGELGLRGHVGGAAAAEAASLCGDGVLAGEQADVAALGVGTGDGGRRVRGRDGEG